MNVSRGAHLVLLASRQPTLAGGTNALTRKITVFFHSSDPSPLGAMGYRRYVRVATGYVCMFLLLRNH